MLLSKPYSVMADLALECDLWKTTHRVQAEFSLF